MSATANPEENNRLIITLSEDRSKIILVFPRKPSREIREKLSSDGYSATNYEGKPAHSLPFSDENWVKAWDFKEWFEKPKIDPELLSFHDPEQQSSPPKTIPTNLIGEPGGADDLVKDFMANMNDPQTRELTFSRVNTLLREMGILDLYLMPEHDARFELEGNVWFRRTRPVLIDDDGNLQAKTDQGIDFPQARKIFGSYTRKVSLVDLVSAAMDWVVAPKKHPISQRSQLRAAARESIGNALKKADQQKGLVTGQQHSQLLDHLFDLKNKLSPALSNNHLTRAERIISQFSALHNRAVSPIRIRNLITSLQDAVKERKVAVGTTPEDQLKALRYIQKKLVGWWNDSLSNKPASFRATVRVNPQKLRQFKALLTKIELNPPDKPEDDSLPVLSGVPGYLIPPPKVRGKLNPISFTTDKPPENREQRYQFSEGWQELWGRPEVGFSAMIYGQPKTGKSTLAMDFAGYLARTGKGPILYSSIEEGARGTLTERINRLEAQNRSLMVKNFLPADLRSFSFVIIDSASRGLLTLELMQQLISDWPKISFLFVFHVTKDGLPRGKNEFMHEVDVLVEVRDKEAVAEGRFGPGKMPVNYGPQTDSTENLSPNK